MSVSAGPAPFAPSVALYGLATGPAPITPSVALHELAKRSRIPAPEYQMISNVDNDGNECYIYKISFASATAEGKGYTMHEARQNAAQIIIVRMQYDPTGFSLDVDHINQTLETPIDMPLLKNEQNFVNHLTKFCAENNLQKPLYEEITEGKTVFPPFTIKCILAGYGEATAEAFTKRQAKGGAAEKLLECLKNSLTPAKDKHYKNHPKTENELQKRQLDMLQHKEDHLMMRQMYPEIPATLKTLNSARKAANWDPVEKVDEVSKEMAAEYNLETTQVQEHNSSLWYYSTFRIDTIPSVQSWNAGFSKAESEKKAAEDLLRKLSIMLTGYDNKMGMLYEVCESTSDVIPFSLYLVLKKLPRQEEKNEVYLFLSVLYVLVLESGFSPVLKSKAFTSEAKWVQQEKQLKNIHYDVNRVYYYTSNFELFTFSLDTPFFWKFAIKELMEITLIIDFISIGTDKLISIKVVLKDSKLGLGQCFKLSEFVSNPEATNFASKFINLRELSMKFKTMMWLARGEAFYLGGYCDKTAFEAVPPHIHENIASFLTKAT